MRSCLTPLVQGRMKEQDYERLPDPPRLGQNEGVVHGDDVLLVSMTILPNKCIYICIYTIYHTCTVKFYSSLFLSIILWKHFL